MTLQTGKTSHRKNKGFTFIEIILVVVIILVVAGFSAPIFRRSFSDIQLKSTCQKLVQLMRYAQARAIAQRQLCRINFDFDKAVFWPSIQDESDETAYKKIKGRWGKGVKIPDGILVETDTSFITFFPDGSSDRTTIRISDNKGSLCVIPAQRTIRYVEVKQ